MASTSKKPAGNINALGKRVTRFQGFDTFPTPPGVTSVECISDEVTSNCPVTEQPDWYVVKIVYVPEKLCVESKTLKLYLQSYRNQGLFCEAFAAKIASDLSKKLDCYVEVSVTQKPRGGVSIVGHAVFDKGEPIRAPMISSRRR
jgi:7-cyano-7-deazaguanine reductase